VPIIEVEHLHKRYQDTVAVEDVRSDLYDKVRVGEALDGLSGMFTGDPRFEVVGEAGDGAEAVTLAEAPRPDVVLMDLRIPRVDGRPPSPAWPSGG
jgi:CheY-like chemotaxis protein